MPAFFEYLRNITYYLMFATVVGAFAPAGKYRKFVSLVLGFILLLLMIQPLAVVFGGRNIPVTEWFAGAIPIPIGEAHGTSNAESSYIHWRDTYLRTAFETQLESQLTQLLHREGFAVHSAAFGYSDDFSTLESVRVSVSVREVEQHTPFIRIVPPQISPIQIGQPQPSETCETTSAVKTLISQFYNLPKSNIYVTVTV